MEQNKKSSEVIPPALSFCPSAMLISFYLSVIYHAEIDTVDRIG
jgi:hypothetical protein